MINARKDLYVASGFTLFSLILGFSTISHYGIMNDAPIKYASGFRNYYFFTKWDEAYLDPKNTHKLAETEGLLDDHVFLNHNHFNPIDYSPIFDTLSVLTCNLFHRTLGWLNYFDAHNAIVIILFAIFCGWFYLFASALCGTWGGLTAGILFFLFPRLIAHSHNNLSDIPLLFFFFATVAVFYRAVTEENSRLLAGACFLFGLTVATKLNGVFLIFILLPWYAAYKVLNRKPIASGEKVVWAVSVFIAYLGWFLPFPYFWTADTIPEFFSRQINSHIFTMLTQENIVGYEGGWNLSVFFQAFATTPTFCLVIFIPGFIVSLRNLIKKSDSRFLLLFFWLFVPIFKSGLPGIKNNEMIRHFMEYIPALLIFCGLGADWAIQRLRKLLVFHRFPYLVSASCLSIAFLSAAFPVYRIHPHEILYFNNLVGGLEGAKQHFMYAYDYWQTSLRTLIVWLNTHAQKDASVTTTSYFDYNVMESVNLRKDLQKQPSLKGVAQTIKLQELNGQSVKTVMRKYNFRGYILQLIKSHDDADLKYYLAIPSLKPEFTLTVENQIVAKIFYLKEDFGIVRRSGQVIILHFNSDGFHYKTTRFIIKNSPKYY